jgi:eukaryotic-like serine/threonine-protein kinase
MVTAVRLTVLTGPHKNRRFCFCGPTRCQVGRDLNCFVQMSGTERDQLISRHHCLLNINPPSIQVEDLGSSNGTYVNGKKVDPSPKETTLLPNSETGLVVNQGDLLTTGGTTFRVDVVDCPHAGSELAGKSIWEAGETAKKDCPLPC